MDRDVNLPMVSIRFAKELFQLVSEDLQWSTDDTSYKNDLQDFLNELDGVIKDRA